MKPLILACDDSPVIQMVLNKGLSHASADYDVLVTENGEQTKAALDSRTPVLFLTDLELPDCRGLELLKICRERFPQCPLAAMSASIDKDTMKELKAMEIRIILVKPIRADTLEKILDHFHFS